MIGYRVAKVEDAKEILEIYTPYITDTAITFEYDIPNIEEFEARIAKTLKKYPYIVAVMDGKIIGYAYASAFKERAAYDWAVETSIYVHKDYKKLGVGKGLYEKLEKALKRQGIINVYACIAYTLVEDEHLTNDSMYFHEHLGYQLVATFNQCGYKFGHWYDMIWMEKMIGSHTANPLPITAFDGVVD